jgi:glycosyltransferase involved in cell wall biosynthesis
MIDIAMLTCNRRRITKLAIHELKLRTTTPHRLIVVDNGSTDGTPQMLHELKSMGLVDVVLELEDNHGVHWGHNTLLNMVTSEPYYISADNDLIPASPVDGVDWLARLIHLAQRFPEYGAIACRPHVLIGEGGNLFNGAPEIKERGHVGAHLRIMQTQAVRDTGGWQREKRPSRNHEERWICGKLREAGFVVGYSRDIRCIHLFGDDTLGEDPWGYTHGTYHEGHREIWPPVNRFSWDRQGIDWETCE